MAALRAVRSWWLGAVRRASCAAHKSQGLLQQRAGSGEAAVNPKGLLT
jgi:hypothetical protein